jgi:predicted nucleic acid-binding protein
LRVLVDTTIWSLALRRRPRKLNAAQRALVGELTELIEEGRAAITGVIRQELLSGLREDLTFERLRRRLRHFDDEVPTVEDHEEAARHHNACRRAGVSGSAIDFLLCAIASRRDLAIFTTDRDFERYARHLSIGLHHARKRD